MHACGQNVFNHGFMLTGYTGNRLAYGDTRKSIAATNTLYKRRLTLSTLSHAADFLPLHETRVECSLIRAFKRVNFDLYGLNFERLYRMAPLILAGEI